MGSRGQSPGLSRKWESLRELTLGHRRPGGCGVLEPMTSLTCNYLFSWDPVWVEAGIAFGRCCLIKDWMQKVFVLWD